MKGVFVLLLTAALISYSHAVPYVYYEPDRVIQQNSFQARPIASNPFTGLIYAQTDVTLAEPGVLGVPPLCAALPPFIPCPTTPVSERDIADDNTIFGRIYGNRDDDADYYVLDIAENAFSNSKPIFGYPLIPAARGEYSNRELVVLVLGPASTPDALVGTIGVPLSSVPSRVTLPANSKLITSTLLNTRDHTGPLYNVPEDGLSYFQPQGLLDNCTQMGSIALPFPPYTPFCNFNNSLKANYPVAGAFPAGRYWWVIYERNGRDTSYLVKTGFQSIVGAWFGPPVNGNLSLASPQLLQSLTHLISVGNLIRYGADVALNNFRPLN